ncbi:TetR/AcrR family transcriptional regulator [Streptosporangiaceae bacterium NEAU-GS5]|nr:TetR/AcrR family transcriptional regulator [Streptosporangiaceae bacterium NEAU-GS5]
MPRPSQKNEILRAALDCFAEQGYEGTRVRHIAERAGVSDAALYRHYPSVEALAQELFAHYFGDYARRIAAATSDGTSEQRLRAAIRATLAYYRQDPAAAMFILLRQHPFQRRLPAGTVYPLEIIERVIAAGQQRGEVREGQPNLLTAIFLGCVLRPIHLDGFAAPGALDLIAETHHDQVIEDAALAALRPGQGEHK